MTGPRERPRVLAVASGGGHWVELLRLRNILDECDTAYLTVNAAYRDDVHKNRFYLTNDATRWNRMALGWSALRILFVMLRERPDVVVSTGAAPGYFAVRMGRLFGARTCWIDSIANVEELSLSGQKVGKFADLWLTQWEHLARPEGPLFRGGII